jgi:chromosome segregation and condensation protein ScpB
MTSTIICCILLKKNKPLDHDEIIEILDQDDDLMQQYKEKREQAY